MADSKYTYKDLKRLQSLPLDDKIALSKLRITEWYDYWEGRVCVSYSGGKDSTVLLKLVRELYPEVPAVYVDTRLDFPEVREYIKNTENVIWIKPKMSFREAIDAYGFCYPSKEIAKNVNAAKRNIPYAVKKFEDENDTNPYHKALRHWKWLIDLDLKISDKCCNVMKEYPLKKFLRENHLTTYVGTLASESQRRRTAWLIGGCNTFKNGKSKPLSFWTEQDILQYILDNNIEITSVYGDIITDEKGKLQTSKENRTGCIFCPVGAHMHKVNKFHRLKESHPALYKYCMNELGLDDFLTKVGIEH